MKSTGELIKRKEIQKCAFGLFVSLGIAYVVLLYLYRFLFPDVIHLEMEVAYSAIFLYLFSLISIFVFFRVLQTTPKFITMFYLINKTLRLLISIGVVLLYGLFFPETMKQFSLGFFLLYLITLVFESRHFFLLESKMKNKNENK